MLKVQCSRIEPRNANLSVVTLSLLEDAMTAEVVEVTRDGRIMIQLQDASGLTVGDSYDVNDPPPPEPLAAESEPGGEGVEAGSAPRRKARRRH